MTEPECTICNGTKQYHAADGKLQFCACLLRIKMKNYLGSELEGYKSANSDEVSRLIGLTRNLLIEAPSTNGRMTTFYAHLRRALQMEFVNAEHERRAPITHKIVSIQDIPSIKFDDESSYSSKRALLSTPHLLIIMAAAWPSYEVGFNETMTLMADRIQRGSPTWLISPDFGKLKTRARVPAEFIVLIDTMKQDSHLRLNEAVVLKGKSKPVLNTIKGNGASGLDLTWVALPKQIEPRIAEMEKHVKDDSYISDGQPSSK